MCALIYQVLWLRMLGWVFGVTVYAASTVWATFMAGLALGSFVAGRLADLQRAYVALYPHLPHSLAALTFARFLIALLVLIVPTALMGATLPLVVKASAFRTGALGRQLGVLYASNAFGAIVGTLAAGLYFIPARGISRTFAIAAALNLVVGATAAILSRRAPLAE